MDKSVMTEIQQYHMRRLRREVIRCANLTLYRDRGPLTDLELISSFLCGSKLCFICNQQRQKATRRKYWKWFGDNPEIIQVKNPQSGIIRFVTSSQASGKYSAWEQQQRHQYDVMHLTLTLPHTAEHGFNGDRYYFEKIAKQYWLMRKVPGWTSLVFGGEYGIETTKKENGLHIHIHSLLLVKREKQNRNRLHRLILKEWNKRSINQYSGRTGFDRTVIDSIRRSNKLLTDSDVDSLDPKGSTMINLEVIYGIDPETGRKIRNVEFNSKTMLIGVMEAISYHFEPQAFDKEGGSFDFQLMAEIMPVIYRKALYKKFGCLHGETRLNVSFSEEKDTLLEYDEVSEMVDQNTGEMLSDVGFYIINPAYVYHFPEKDFTPLIANQGKKIMVRLDSITTREAIEQMGILFQAQIKNRG